MANFNEEEEKYLTSKENFKQYKRKTKSILRNQKRKLSKIFKSENKIKFRMLDILFFSLILFNIGALVITNMLALKTQPDAQFMEGNPATAENYELVEAPDARPFMTGFIIHIIAWSYIIGWYLYNRIYLHTKSEFYLFIGRSIWVATIAINN